MVNHTSCSSGVRTKGSVKLSQEVYKENKDKKLQTRCKEVVKQMEAPLLGTKKL